MCCKALPHPVAMFLQVFLYIYLSTPSALASFQRGTLSEDEVQNSQTAVNDDGIRTLGHTLEYIVPGNRCIQFLIFYVSRTIGMQCILFS